MDAGARLRQQLGLVAADETGVEQAGLAVRQRERAMRAHRRQELQVGSKPDHLVFAQRRAQAPQSGIAIHIPADQLGDHRVVVHADLVALAHAAVDAHVRGGRRHAQMLDAARRGQEVARRILGVDARLDRMPVDGQLLLRQRQRLARGHAQLPLHQVEAGDHLGHRVLDLQPGVHLHEVELAALVRDELHGAGVDVAHRARRGHRRRADLPPPRGRHARGGRLFQNLLMAPLHGAVALEQMNRRCRARRRTPASRCGAGAARYFSISTRSSPKAEAASRLRGAERGLELGSGSRRCACPCRRRRPTP